jgi:cytoskeletal protein CcmA (bactofilin family)
MKRRNKKGKNYSLDTLIGAQTAFEGSICSERSVCVEGSVHGRIEAKGEVVIGRDGRVEADVRAESVVVGGRVVGNITARRRLEITTTGRVIGDIEATTITVAEGGMVDGLCKMIHTAESIYPQLEQGSSAEESEQPNHPSQSDPVEELPQS